MSDSIVVKDYEHEEVHEGNVFYHNNVHSVGAGATLDFVLEVGNTNLHYLYAIDSDTAGFTYQFYEGVTVDPDGTEIELFNHNRESGNEPEAVLRQDPTVTALTTEKNLSGGNKGTASNPAQTKGGSGSRSNEDVLKKNTKYLLRIVNLSASANPINVLIKYYKKNVVG